MKQPNPTKMIPVEAGHSCQRQITLSNKYIGKIGTVECGKPATYKSLENSKYYCYKHSLKGRFIFRKGEGGEIVARFDTIEELTANKSVYSGYTAQHIGQRKRTNLYI